MNAYQELEKLSEEVRAGRLAALDEMLVLAKAYMEPGRVPESYQHLRLGLSEARILSLLVKRRGCALSKEAIHAACYFDRPQEPEIDIVDVWVCKLRAKLKGTEDRNKLETIHGYGYRMAA
jgi:two-component system cell cycle response regulator CtrA